MAFVISCCQKLVVYMSPFSTTSSPIWTLYFTFYAQQLDSNAVIKVENAISYELAQSQYDLTSTYIEIKRAHARPYSQSLSQHLSYWAWKVKYEDIKNGRDHFRMWQRMMTYRHACMHTRSHWLVGGNHVRTVCEQCMNSVLTPPWLCEQQLC